MSKVLNYFRTRKASFSREEFTTPKKTVNDHEIEKKNRSKQP